MKALFYIPFALALISCSDTLTRSRAEHIMNTCLSKNPNVETVKIGYGNFSFSKDQEDQNLLQKYKKLAAGGYLVIDSVGVLKSPYYPDRVIYDVKLSGKSKNYVIRQQEYSSGKYIAEVKAYEYKVDEITEVHEIPSLNAAEVRVTYKISHKSPFTLLRDENEADFKVATETFKKTTDGWKFCEK